MLLKAAEYKQRALTRFSFLTANVYQYSSRYNVKQLVGVVKMTGKALYVIRVFCA
jgi:hypothetical protein